MTLHAKLGMSEIQRYPWKLCRIKCMNYIFMFLFIFICCFFAKVIAQFLLIRNNWEIFRVKHLKLLEITLTTFTPIIPDNIILICSSTLHIFMLNQLNIRKRIKSAIKIYRKEPRFAHFIAKESKGPVRGGCKIKPL